MLLPFRRDGGFFEAHGIGFRYLNHFVELTPTSPNRFGHETPKLSNSTGFELKILLTS